MTAVPTYCGPLVVANILGTSSAEVNADIERMRAIAGGMVYRGSIIQRTRKTAKSAVRGTTQTELFALLQRAGYSFESVDVGARVFRYTQRTAFINNDNGKGYLTSDGLAPRAPGNWLPFSPLKTRAAPLSLVLHRFRSGTFIVETPSHWALARDGMWVETFTRGEWVPLSQAPKQRRVVLQAWRVAK
jgi:hypothetical protein